MNVSQVTYSSYQIGFINRPAVNPAAPFPADNTAKPNTPGHSASAVTTVNPAIQPAQAGDTPSGQKASPSETGSKQAATNPDNPSGSSSNAAQTPQPDTQTVNGRELSAEELQVLEQLQQTDNEVRSHEMAHIAAGGRYITSGASFTYQRGPDGRNYAVSGEVGIDTSAVPGDPKATLQKMRQVKNAALAPASPSSQDLKVASNATAAAAKALAELMVLTAQSQAQKNQTRAFGNLEQASNTYQQVNDLPQEDTSTFQIAV